MGISESGRNVGDGVSKVSLEKGAFSALSHPVHTHTNKQTKGGSLSV